MSRAKGGGRKAMVRKERIEFVNRLRSCIQARYPSASGSEFERFKEDLRTHPTRISESTVRNWFPPLTRLRRDQVRATDWDALRTPDVPAIRAISDVLDISVDYLLGYSVPQRRSDRELVSDLARQLLAHVVRVYDQRPWRGSEMLLNRHDGLAAAVGGKIIGGQAGPETREGPSQRPAVGEALPNGDVVINDLLLSGLVVLRADPQELLRRVCDWVTAEATNWERNNEEIERQNVQSDVALLMERISDIAAAMDLPEVEVAKRLALAVRTPLEPIPQAYVVEFRRELPKWEERRAADAAQEGALNAALHATLAELEVATDSTSTKANKRRTKPLTRRGL